MKPTSTLEAVVRGAAGVLGSLLGYLAGRWFVSQGVLNESINLVYLTLVGLLLGYLLSGPLVGLSERAVRRSRLIPPDAVLAAGLGTTAALVLTVLLNSVLEQVPGFSWQVSVLMTVMLVVTSSWFFVHNRGLFIRVKPLTPPEAAEPGEAAAGNGPVLNIIVHSGPSRGRGSGFPTAR